MDVVMEMNLAGQAVPVESNSVFNYTMTVDDKINGGDYLMSFKYDRIQSRSGGTMEMKYDSNKPESADSPLGMQLSPLVKPVFSMKIDYLLFFLYLFMNCFPQSWPGTIDLA